MAKKPNISDIFKQYVTAGLKNHCPCFPQNFSPQMSGGYDDKSSPAMAVPGPMVVQTHTHTYSHHITRPSNYLRQP